MKHLINSTGRWTAVAVLFVALAFPATIPAAPATQSLAGWWRFRVDAQDAGLREEWFKQELPQRIKLPGAMAESGFGEDIALNTKWTGEIVDRSFFTAPEFEKYRQPGQIKVPFWLQPDKHYIGAAWYQRDFELPAKWQGRRVVLTLERPHWETRLWLDGRLVGTNLSLSTPHVYDLGTGLAPGKHQLTLRVDNRLVVDVGPNSHSVSDHTQGNWNGVVGRLELSATEPVWIEDLQVYPHVATKSITVKGTLGNATGQAGQGPLKFAVEQTNPQSRPTATRRKPPASKPLNVTWDATGGTFEAEIALGDQARIWEEFSPVVYRLTATLGTASRSTTFGLREIATHDTQFVLNGQKIFFRGTLDCCIYPLTGYPPTDVGAWKRIVSIAKAHGLNHIRFHSWCPPEAAFVAADELGFYFQVEAASWANSTTTLGDGKPVDPWLYEETDRILKAYGNHPSFLLMLYGNEPGGAKHADYLAQYVNHYKERDPRRLFSSASGWPQIPENQFHVTPDPRVQAWGGGLNSRINARPPETVTDYRDYIQQRKVPVISHEIGQWCVFPNFDEIPKYKGYLKPKNFEIFRDLLQAHQLGDQARDFLLASGKLQTLCYKEDIESALRTPGMGGFQLLDLHDFPGQGTALVGVLDPFWDSKGYVTPAEFSRFCASTVPLARLTKRVFTQHETIDADIEVAHFGAAPIDRAVINVRLVSDAGKEVASGTLPSKTIPVDNGVKLGTVNIDLKNVPAPARYKLVVSILSVPERTTVTGPGASRSSRLTPMVRYANDWDVWVYPPKVNLQPPSGITVAHELNDPTLATLKAGGKVLLLVPPTRVMGDRLGKVALGFSSIFWNTAWTGRQPPHTLGILCAPKHPALADFPTEYHSNWQWWYLINQAQAMILDDLPASLRPTVQVIDDWFTSRKLGLVFEGKIGTGRLVVCSIDLEQGAENNPVARQMLYSLFAYMAGDKFQPATELKPEQVRALIARPSAVQRYGGYVVKASSAEPNFDAKNLIDGDPRSLWHTAWTADKPAFPHEVALGFQRPLKIAGFTVLPRQDKNRNGRIKDYAAFTSEDGKRWEPVDRGQFADNDSWQILKFKTPVLARFFRLQALSGYATGPYASLAELDVLAAEE